MRALFQHCRMITILSATLPHTYDPSLIRRGEERWLERARESGVTGIADFAVQALTDGSVGPLLKATFGNSPFLTQELVGNIAFVRQIVELGPDKAFARLVADLESLDAAKLPTPAIMKALRQAKRRAALLAGLADIAGQWPLEAVTGALSRIAEVTLRQATLHLLATPPFAKLPANGDGLIVLGMGKLGAYELNYSSDIDLVIFYDDTQFASKI